MQRNFRLTAKDGDGDVRRIIMNLGATAFPVLEGQSIGITAPGTDADGKPHLPRLHSVSSPRDGERSNYNNLSLNAKREDQGVCSNFFCDLKAGDEVQVIGPFDATFLMPNDAETKLLMICTGKGAALFRAMTMCRQRTDPTDDGILTVVFGARTLGDLPCFGPRAKMPDRFLAKYFAFSGLPDEPKQYVQDQLRAQTTSITPLLRRPKAPVETSGKSVKDAAAEVVRAVRLLTA